MTLPNVTVNELTVLLGNSINGTDLLSFSDDDGDVIEQFRVRDNNPNSDSSFLIHNGVVLTANVDHTFDAATLNQLVLNSGTSIQGNEYQFQAFSNGEWGPVNTQLISSVVQNVNGRLLLPATSQWCKVNQLIWLTLSLPLIRMVFQSDVIESLTPTLVPPPVELLSTALVR